MEVRSLDQWVSVAPEPLSLGALVDWATRDGCGAVVSFSGTVRDSSSSGQDVLALEYDTSERLAVVRIEEVLAEARRRWPDVETLAVHHRTGRVELGDPTVLVVAASAHRTEAFESARFCIDAVKSTVPMWKREIWEGGSAWSQEATPIASVRDL